MVLRSIKSVKLCIFVKKAKIAQYKRRLEKEFGKEFKISIEDDGISVEGDLHNPKKRNRIVYILTGGKYGQDV